jgi:hypothetical protein
LLVLRKLFALCPLLLRLLHILSMDWDASFSLNIVVGSDIAKKAAQKMERSKYKCPAASRRAKKDLSH